MKTDPRPSGRGGESLGLQLIGLHSEKTLVNKQRTGGDLEFQTMKWLLTFDDRQDSRAS
jgi:hypothetical protein